jgi:cytochrome c5
LTCIKAAGIFDGRQRGKSLPSWQFSLQIENAMKNVCAVLLMICAWSNAGFALDREQQRGKDLLETLCGQCHAVSETGKSADIAAPPFRTLGDDKLYDNDFGERLQEGLTTIHPNMPTFRFSRDDAEAAVNYLKAIQVHKKPR